MVAVKLYDPNQAETMVERLNSEFPGISASLASDFADQMPDMQNSNSMISGISFVAILVGGVGVLNTMLMSVFERTREIGVLRSLGWRRRSILGLIMREAIMLGFLGGIAGIMIAFGLGIFNRACPNGRGCTRYDLERADFCTRTHRGAIIRSGRRALPGLPRHPHAANRSIEV